MLNINHALNASAAAWKKDTIFATHAVSHIKTATTSGVQKNSDLFETARLGCANIVVETVQKRPANYFLRGLTTVCGLLAVAGVTEVNACETLQPSVVAGQILPVKTIRPLASHFSDSWNEMQTYHGLDDGWDGPGSVAPSRGILNVASSMLRLFPADVIAPEAMVSADGTAGWFWSNENIYVSIEFTSQKRYTYFARTSDKVNVARGDVVFDRVSIPSDLLEIIRMA